MNYLRTAILLAGLTALFMGVGYLIGGGSGAIIALFVAAGMNLVTYWNADKLVLSMHGAHEVDERTAPDLVRLVHDLAHRAGLPMPRVYIMDNPQPNAFATGRNPENAAVAVTTGLLEMLSREELAGVIAHELAHIRNRDTLTMTITATIAGAISMLAQFGLFFGGHRDNNSGLGTIGTIAMVILAPIAAMLVQMAISRTREYAADQLGARISGRPDALASALLKISSAAQHIENPSRRARAGDRASLHRQSADPPRHRQPVRDPSLDREPHRRAAAPGAARWGKVDSAGARPRPTIPPARRTLGAMPAVPATAAPGVEVTHARIAGRVPSGSLRHGVSCQMTATWYAPFPPSNLPAWPHGGSPPTSSTACCAGVGRSTSSSTTRRRIPTMRRCRIATARWCACSRHRCCAGSARCAISSVICSNAAFPPTRRGWKPRC